MRQYETFELSFTGPEPEGSQAVIGLEAEFACGKDVRRVKGFYAGNGTYKVRFLPLKAGTYTWKVSGLFEAEGSEKADKADKDHHGPVRADGTHFRYADGSWFYPFGTTVYAMMHQDAGLIDRTMKTLSEAPFNKVRLCVFPKHYNYNHNDPDHYAFTKRADGSWDVDHPDYAFWDAFEARLTQLASLGIQADLIMFHPYDRWGFDAMPQQDNLTYLDYLLRRFAALPNLWWSLANEYDLSPAKTLADWEEIEAFVASHDPYGHLLSNHNCFKPWDWSRPNVTHISWQSKQLNRVAEMQRVYGKPYINDECRYEGTLPEPWGNMTGEEMTRRFWKIMVQGGYCTHGETFYPGEDEVVWWARGGELRGKSVSRIAFLRNVCETLPGPIEPGQAGFVSFMGMSDEALSALVDAVPEERRHFMSAFLRQEQTERDLALAVEETTFAGHVGDEAFLWYYDAQCPAVAGIDLPEDKTYMVEILDTWEKTRRSVNMAASGHVDIVLPGKPYMAVLATVKKR